MKSSIKCCCAGVVDEFGDIQLFGATNFESCNVPLEVGKASTAASLPPATTFYGSREAQKHPRYLDW
jgi:hypothetical protein